MLFCGSVMYLFLREYALFLILFESMMIPVTLTFLLSERHYFLDCSKNFFIRGFKGFGHKIKDRRRDVLHFDRLIIMRNLLYKKLYLFKNHNSSNNQYLTAEKGKRFLKYG